MPTLHLLFSHNLTEEQISDAKQNLGITEFVSLPEDLQNKWSQIPPEGELSDSLLYEFKTYLNKQSQSDDFVLIQGEFGMVFNLVYWCLQNSRIPVYATTKRLTDTITKSDGSVKKSQFLNTFSLGGTKDEIELDIN